MIPKSRSSLDSYLGCARGYLNLKRFKECELELKEAEDVYGFREGIFSLMLKSLEASEDWDALCDYGRSVIEDQGEFYDGGWICLIRGLIGCELHLRACFTARNAQPFCGNSPMVQLESLRALVVSERLNAARTYFLDTLSKNPGFQLLVAEDDGFESFLSDFASGKLSELAEGEDLWLGDVKIPTD